MLHAIIYKDKILGLYSNLEKCKLMIRGLENNMFVTKKLIQIKSFHENSIAQALDDEDNNEFFIGDDTIEVTTESDNTDSIHTNDLSSTKQEELKKTRENKSKIEYNLNILKKQKEQINESKEVYKLDYELYKKFTKMKEKDEKFIIPELFTQKFEIMTELDKQGKLIWENFYEAYKPMCMNTSYDKLFEYNENVPKKLIVDS